MAAPALTVLALLAGTARAEAPPPARRVALPPPGPGCAPAVTAIARAGGTAAAAGLVTPRRAPLLAFYTCAPKPPAGAAVPAVAGWRPVGPRRRT